MTRLNETSPDPWLEQKSKEEKLKEEIREEVITEMKRKKRRKTLTCCFLELLSVVLVLSLIATAVAKTGLVKVPLFSKIFYKTSAPQKVVTVTSEEIKNFETDITEKLKSQVKSQIKPGAPSQKVEVNFEFTEKELTSFLKNLEAQKTSPLGNAQVSVTKEAIEIFGEMEEPSKTSLTVAFKPEIKDDKLIIVLKKIKLGALPLPSSLGNFLVDKFLSSQLRAAGEAISKTGKLESIALEEGKIVLKGLVDVIVFTQE